MNYRVAHFLKVTMNLLACAVALVVFFGQFAQGMKWVLLVVAIALLIGGSVIGATFCRCPHCGNILPVKWKLPHICPNCDGEL